MALGMVAYFEVEIHRLESSDTSFSEGMCSIGLASFKVNGVHIPCASPGGCHSSVRLRPQHLLSHTNISLCMSAASQEAAWLDTRFVRVCRSQLIHCAYLIDWIAGTMEVGLLHWWS